MPGKIWIYKWRGKIYIFVLRKGCEEVRLCIAGFRRSIFFVHLSFWLCLTLWCFKVLVTRVLNLRTINFFCLEQCVSLFDHNNQYFKIGSQNPHNLGWTSRVIYNKHVTCHNYELILKTIEIKKIKHNYSFIIIFYKYNNFYKYLFMTGYP